jgi:hypothetical protein
MVISSIFNLNEEIQTGAVQDLNGEKKILLC